jgi:hypothetical protein
MNPHVRSGLAVLGGLFYGAVIIMVVELFGSLFFRPPEGWMSPDPEVQRAAFAKVPAAAFGMVLVAWGLGTFGGAWLAGFIAKSKYMVQGLVVATVFLLAAVWNMMMLPHPWWCWVVGLPIFPLGGFLGAQVAERVVRQRAAEAAAKAAAKAAKLPPQEPATSA